MLYALTVRSPVASGQLISIECPKLPNSYTLISAKDIPGKNRLENSELPIFAAGRLSYIGEPVALLLGPDKKMLEKYAEQCKVMAEESPPVFGDSGGAVLARREIRTGEPEAAFERAASVTRGDYRTGIQEHWYAEPTGAVAWLEKPEQAEESPAGLKDQGAFSGSHLIVRTATQWPFHVKRSLAQTLNITAARIRVEPTALGLHMDGKLWYPSLIACHAALGACITKKPVRLMLTREEDFYFSPKRNSAQVSIASALDETGRITGTEIEITVNMGAYGVNVNEILDQTCLGSTGVYTCGNLKLSARAVSANIPPQGPFCGFGLAQGLFALERHVSRIAGLHRQNPAEWRKNNFLKNGGLPVSIITKENPPVEPLLDTAASMSDYYRKWASCELLRQSRKLRLTQNPAEEPLRENHIERSETLRGIGIALGYQGSGLLYPGADRGNYSIELTLEKDGVLLIKTSAASAGNNYSRVWAAIAAEILSIDAESVRIIYTNSRDSGPATASRPAAVLTKMMEQACLAIRKQRFRDPLPITVRKNIKPQTNAKWEELFPPPPGTQLDISGFSRPGWAAAVVEVEIDEMECIPAIRGVWLSVDGGKILSEDSARRSLKIAAVQALGWASREQIDYSGGLIPHDQIENYYIPSPAEIPPIHIDFIWNDGGEPKGIGGLPFTCIPAAYLQAVSQAMDTHFQSIPLGHEQIWEAGKPAGTERQP
ncbi:MAG: molybdopterin-dependent oxidoreductase [Treponema sp.]|jgi:CO/xanthine dehydrogenase Mo-binding subunit|nr:molybdopterin-dependent oxidoreductase [Treponema sp.]